MSRKPALGRGLDALLNGVDELSSPEIKADSEEVVYLSVDSLTPNSAQPRQRFDKETISELAESIRQQGVIQPILAEAKNDGSYMIIAGERRLRASKEAGLDKVPVLIKDISPEQKFEIALVENVQRENLTPMEEARAYYHLMDALNLSQQDVADKVGKNRATIANSLRLLHLPQAMGNAVESGKISAGHARALLSVRSAPEQEQLFAKILTDSLSVREAEACAGNMKQPHKNSKKISALKDMKFREKNSELIRIEDQFIRALGTKVRLKGSLDKGRMEVFWFSKEDLERIYDQLAENPRS